MARQHQSQESPPVRLSEKELARRTSEGPYLRTTPLRLRFHLTELVTSDAHRLSLTFDCAVLPRPEPAERAMLAEAFLTHSDTCTTADVVRTLTPPLSAAARTIISSTPAVECLTDATTDRLTATLRRAVDAAGFTTGLEAVAPYTLHVESPSLQRMDLDRAAREQAEREQASRLANLRRAGEVLKEFESIRQAAPDVPVSVLLSRLSPADQPHVVQSLLDASPKSARTLYAVAGSRLLKISTVDLAVDEIPIPAEEVGPFRSVQTVHVSERPYLAIGGRAGIVLTDTADPSQTTLFRAGDVASTMGFNRVVTHDGRLLASHSELGVLAWSLDIPTAPPTSLVTRGARNLEITSGRVVYTAGAHVLSTDAPSTAPDGDPIVALLPTPAGLIAVHPSGDIDLLDPHTLSLLRRDRRSARVTAAATMPFFDSPRVLLATEDGPVTCLSNDDAIVTQYATTHRGFRALAAAPGLIAGVSADRQRIVLLEPSPHSPAVREVYAAARFRHRVAGIALV